MQSFNYSNSNFFEYLKNGLQYHLNAKYKHEKQYQADIISAEVYMLAAKLVLPKIFRQAKLVFSVKWG